MEKREVKVLGFTARDRQLALKTTNRSLTLSEDGEIQEGVINSVEELKLARLVLSLNKVGNQLGRALDLGLKSIQIEVIGELTSVDQENVNQDFPFKKVTIVVKPSSDVSIVALKEWMDELKRRCPIFTSFYQQLPTKLTLVKEYEQIKVA